MIKNDLKILIILTIMSVENFTKRELKMLMSQINSLNSQLSDTRRDLNDVRRELTTVKSNQVDAVKVVKDVLENNVVMRDLRERHAQALEGNLHQVAAEVLQKVADEEQYHMMQREVRTAAENRVQALIADQEMAFFNMTQQHTKKVNEHLEKTREENEKSLKNVREAEKRLKEFERSLFITQIVGVSTVFLLFGVILLK